MLRRNLLSLARRPLSTMSSATPMEDVMRSKVVSLTPARRIPLLIIFFKITEALKPTTLEIHNDSHRHSHHKAMEGSVSKETHFRFVCWPSSWATIELTLVVRVVITSNAFKSKMQPARHRMVYALLKDEMAQEGGIHALQLRTRTPDEEERQLAREREERGELGKSDTVEAA